MALLNMGAGLCVVRIAFPRRYRVSRDPDSAFAGSLLLVGKGTGMASRKWSGNDFRALRPVQLLDLPDTWARCDGGDFPVALHLVCSIRASSARACYRFKLWVLHCGRMARSSHRAQPCFQPGSRTRCFRKTAPLIVF